MIQISLHYKCKDEFKNTQDSELFSHSPHIQRLFDLTLHSHSKYSGKSTEETIREVRYRWWSIWYETAF